MVVCAAFATVLTSMSSKSLCPSSFLFNPPMILPLKVRFYFQQIFLSAVLDMKIHLGEFFWSHQDFCCDAVVFSTFTSSCSNPISLSLPLVLKSTCWNLHSGKCLLHLAINFWSNLCDPMLDVPSKFNSLLFSNSIWLQNKPDTLCFQIKRTCHFIKLNLIKL